MNSRIRNKFIEVKYSVSYGLAIFISDNLLFRIFDISHNKILNPIGPVANKILIRP